MADVSHSFKFRSTPIHQRPAPRLHRAAPTQRATEAARPCARDEPGPHASANVSGRGFPGLLNSLVACVLQLYQIIVQRRDSTMYPSYHFRCVCVIRHAHQRHFGQFNHVQCANDPSQRQACRPVQYMQPIKPLSGHLHVKSIDLFHQESPRRRTSTSEQLKKQRSLVEHPRMHRGTRFGHLCMQKAQEELCLPLPVLTRNIVCSLRDCVCLHAEPKNGARRHSRYHHRSASDPKRSACHNDRPRRPVDLTVLAERIALKNSPENIQPLKHRYSSPQQPQEILP